MIDTYYAASYWLARPESVEACARRAAHFFHLLGRCDSAWSHWYETAASFEEARRLQFRTDAPSFQKLFAREENHFGDRCSLHLWTGERQEETSVVDANCGSSSHWVPSSCVLRPYDESPIGKRVLTAPVMAGVVRAMALAWEPEWAIATSREHRDSVTESAELGTFVGWVMYFSRLRGPVPPLPAPVRIEPVEDKGTLVILTPEPFTASSPEHVGLAARVHELLTPAGLLRPLQPWPVG